MKNADFTFLQHEKTHNEATEPYPECNKLFRSKNNVSSSGIYFKLLFDKYWRDLNMEVVVTQVALVSIDH